MDWQDQMVKLVAALNRVASKRGDTVRIILQEGRYLRVMFTDAKTQQLSTGEFYFTPSDTTVQYRIGGTAGGAGAVLLQSQRNIDRAEALRKELGYLKLPVLRNRKRTLLFVESDLDTFGPGSASLGPPAEMQTGELEGRQDVDPNLAIDVLQNFPQQQITQLQALQQQQMQQQQLQQQQQQQQSKF